MHLLQQIAFVLLAGVSIQLFVRKAGEIRRNILLGRDEDYTDQPGARWKNLVLLALGQKKMFHNPLVAVMHLVIYAGFIIINIEVLEIFLDGILGTHRLFAPYLGKYYKLLINAFELLAVAVIAVCIVFLLRRNIARIKRFAGYQFHATGDFIISGKLQFLLSGMSSSTLVLFERTAWWLHIIGIFAFLNYLPWSKHLHILLAFPNAYYARLQPAGKMTNMPEIQKEVLYAMQPETAPATGESEAPRKFGAKDIFDLSWRNLMDAYSCTECGRCSAACPANQTGKRLSPRKIMMDTRDRMEAVGRNINANGSFEDDGKSLLRDHISEEELRACTTCNACVEACPVSISPLEIIVQMRRYLVMEESNAPQEWTMMFGNVENNFAPWKFAPDERGRWVEEL